MKEDLKIFYVLTSSFIILEIISNFLVYTVFRAENTIKSFPYTIPIYQVGSFIAEGYDISIDEKEYLEKLIPIELWKERFVKYNPDPIAREWSVPYEYKNNYLEFDYKSLIGLNLKFLIKDPAYYMKSFLGMNNLVWKMNPVYGEYQVVLYEEEILDVNYYGTRYVIKLKKTPINNLTASIKTLFLEKSIFYNFKTRGGFSLFMILITVGLLIYKKKKEMIMPVLPIIISSSMLFFSIQMSLSRYCFFIILSWSFFFICALFGKDDNETYS